MTAAEIKLARSHRLTERQQAILDFIREHIRSHGMPPTLRAIGKAFNIRSTNGVNDHLRALERKGHLLRHSMLARGMVPTSTEMDVRTPDAIAALQSEIYAYRSLLTRALHAGRRLPTVTAEMVVVLGDIRDAVVGRVA